MLMTGFVDRRAHRPLRPRASGGVYHAIGLRAHHAMTVPD